MATVILQLRRRALGVAGVLLLLAFGGCSKPESASPSNERAQETARNTSYALGTKISFAKTGDSERFRGPGWSQTEEQHTWTDGNTAILNFTGLAPSRPFVITMTTVGFTKDPQLVSQPTQVVANGVKIADWDVRDKKQYNATIPSGTVDAKGKLTLEFRMPNAVSPKSLGVSADTRQLGLDVFDVVINQAN